VQPAPEQVDFKTFWVFFSAFLIIFVVMRKRCKIRVTVENWKKSQNYKPENRKAVSELFPFPLHHKPSSSKLPP